MLAVNKKITKKIFSDFFHTKSREYTEFCQGFSPFWGYFGHIEKTPNRPF